MVHLLHFLKVDIWELIVWEVTFVQLTFGDQLLLGPSMCLNVKETN